MPAKKPTLKKTTTEKTVVKPQKSGVSVDVLDAKGKVAETIQLPKSLFDSKVNPKLVAQAIRVYLSRKRAGSASTKSRGQVRGSTRKIYRQKGTGRARHGGIRAPIFIHGGIALGPKPRDFSLSMPQKARKAALTSALTAKLKGGEIKVITGLGSDLSKTKLMAQALSQFEKNKKKRNILLLLGDRDTKHIVKAARNIEGIDLLPANLLNAYEVLEHRLIVLMKESVAVLEKTFGRE